MSAGIATPAPPAIRGINGDVREPSYIIWLRHGHPRRLCASLAQAGVIDVAVHTPDPCRDDPEPFDTPLSGPPRDITKCGIRS